jgi:hypothetical protein
LNLEEFEEVVTTVIGIPKFLNQLVYKKIDTEGKGSISKEQFKTFWKNELEAKEAKRRLFETIAQTNSKYIVPEDFKPIMKSTPIPLS